MIEVIYINEDKDGKVTLTKEELTKVINDAYEKGKKDGREENNFHWSLTQPYYASNKTDITC